MNKIYIYAFLIVVIIGFVKWYSDNQYDAGYNAYKAELADSKDSQDKKEEKQVDTLISKKTELKKQFKKKEKKIDKAKDKTGCADVKLIDMGFGLQ